MKQTAVEWFNRQIRLNSKIKENTKGAISFTLGLSKFDELFEQAKAMEKEQIIDAFFEGKNDGILMERYSDYEHITPYEYYNETFKSE